VQSVPCLSKHHDPPGEHLARAASPHRVRRHARQEAQDSFSCLREVSPKGLSVTRVGAWRPCAVRPCRTRSGKVPRRRHTSAASRDEVGGEEQGDHAPLPLAAAVTQITFDGRSAAVLMMLVYGLSRRVLFSTTRPALRPKPAPTFTPRRSASPSLAAQ
jgi:hypothetical protein